MRYAGTSTHEDDMFHSARSLDFFHFLSKKNILHDMKKISPSLVPILQVGSIMVITLLVVLIFFRMRPSILPVPTLQESVYNTIDIISPAVVMIVDRDGISGAGLIIDTQGTILTSKHLIQTGARYGIRFANNDIEWARPLAFHPTLDLALMKLEVTHTTPQVAIISSQALLRSGDFVLAFGALPSSQSFMTHFGILSEMNQSLTVGQKNFS